MRIGLMRNKVISSPRDTSINLDDNKGIVRHSFPSSPFDNAVFSKIVLKLVFIHGIRRKVTTKRNSGIYSILA